MALVQRLALFILGYALKPISSKNRARIVLLFIRAARGKSSAEDYLRFLLGLDRALYGLTGCAAIEYDHGIHTKHRHMKYAQFFIDHISKEDRVLDVGCGHGAVAYQVARQSQAEVVGIDLNEDNIRLARERHTHENVTYVCGDITNTLPDGRFDVVILSNILEHIKDRIAFLQSVISHAKPRLVLVRVPMYEREWRVPLMDELGVPSRLDSTHYIEYREDELLSELRGAGLRVEEVTSRWGEFYVVAKAVD